MADHFAYNHSAVTSHAAFPLSNLRRYICYNCCLWRGAGLYVERSSNDLWVACGQLRHSAARMGTYSRQLSLLSFFVQIAPLSTCTHLEVKGHMHINWGEPERAPH